MTGNKQVTLLFDIDGTLLKTDGAGRKAMNLSIEKLFKIKGALDKTSLAGATDRGLFNAICVKWNKDKNSFEIWHKIYSEYLLKILEKSKVELYPGIKNFLLKATDSGFILGLFTGNSTRAALLKITFAGIQNFFFPGQF